MVVAIDGPAGAGKSTIAKLIAEKLEYVFLNSGSFYRAITYSLLKDQIDLSNEQEVLEFTESLNLDYKNAHVYVNGEDVEAFIRTPEIDMNSSKVSCLVPLRHIVNKKLRLIAENLSIVCEGRDMTTVVFPNAEYKFYLDASLESQAKRRFEQGTSTLSLEEIKQQIAQRDEIDKNKAEGALKISKEAHYIDTSDLTIEEVCAIMIGKITDKGYSMVEKDVMMDESQETKGSVQTQFEDYLNNQVSQEVGEGQLVEGVVVQITADQVYVDVRCKSEGKIPISEFTELPKIGETVNVILVTKENKHGEVIVSKQKADLKYLWKNLRQAFSDKEAVDGTINKVVKGGFDVSLGANIHAFLPTSQSDTQKVDKPEKLIGVKSKMYIERLYADNKINIVVNRRRCLEEITETNRNEFFEKIQIGESVKGAVKSFTSFGAFIDLGGFDGLLHINDMSWGHVTRPKDFVKKGQEIELKVIRLDPNEKRINLSLKHFSEDPWVHFEDKYNLNDVVKGTVTKLTEFGAFIELEEGIEGLAHISEFSWVKKITKPGEMLSIGDEVECMILGYDIQAGRVSLGLKQVTDNPWDDITEKFPVGTKITGKVVKITNAGAFVELEEGIDGFLHGDDLSWTKKVKHVGSELTVGQEIDVIVTESDAEAHRIRVSVKALTEDPWQAFAADNESGSTFEGEVVSITDFGLFVRAPCGIEGLVNKSNLTDDREESYEEAVKKYAVGDKINVFVVDINPSKQKAAFSVKEFKKKVARDEISHYMSSTNDEDDAAYTLGDMLKNKQ